MSYSSPEAFSESKLVDLLSSTGLIDSGYFRVSHLKKAGTPIASSGTKLTQKLDNQICLFVVVVDVRVKITR